MRFRFASALLPALQDVAVLAGGAGCAFYDDAVAGGFGDSWAAFVAALPNPMLDRELGEVRLSAGRWVENGVFEGLAAGNRGGWLFNGSNLFPFHMESSMVTCTKPQYLDWKIVKNMMSLNLNFSAKVTR
jgi:hypothetical protein